MKDNNEKKENAAPHIICSGCYRFNEFKQKCTFYWGGKKECGSKVKDYDDMIMLDHLRRR